MVKLGEVADFVRGPFGGSLTKSIFKENGYAVYEQQHAIYHHTNIRYFIEQIKFDEMQRFKVKPGDLIMSCSGTIGEVYIIPSNAPVGVINQALLKLSVTSKLDRNYFKNWLESPIFKDIIFKFSKGAAIPNVPGVKILKEIEIPLPPLEEQHRIVSILDASFEKIDALKKNAEENLKNAKALFQQVLAQELKPKEGWVEKKLGEVGDFKNGMNFAHNESGTEIHMLGVGDFGDLFFINDVEKLPILSLNKLPSEDYLLKDEDIVFVRSNGNKQLVGRSLVVYPKGVLTTFSGFCIRFRKRIDDINIIFLTYYLKTKDTRKKLFGNGANISNLNQKMLQDLLFVYPSLEEQHRIVQTLDTLSEKCRRLEEIAQQTIRECDALKQSILRQAFSGEL